MCRSHVLRRAGDLRPRALGFLRPLAGGAVAAAQRRRLQVRRGSGASACAVRSPPPPPPMLSILDAPSISSISIYMGHPSVWNIETQLVTPGTVKSVRTATVRKSLAPKWGEDYAMASSDDHDPGTPPLLLSLFSFFSSFFLLCPSLCFFCPLFSLLMD